MQNPEFGHLSMQNSEFGPLSAFSTSSFNSVMSPQVPWAVISTFLTDYLATNAHLGVPGATAVLFSFGIGCFAGTAVGG